MSGCVKCGNPNITKAHVKDKSTFEEEGIKGHQNLNIVELCYNCHYNLFDKGKMGILQRDNVHFFVYLDNENKILEEESKGDLNVRKEYIRWKNLRCNPKLLRRLFQK
jgi:predicted nucleic-acid-binding Zn-ribbon protein